MRGPGLRSERYSAPKTGLWPALKDAFTNDDNPAQHEKNTILQLFIFIYAQALEPLRLVPKVPRTLSQQHDEQQSGQRQEAKHPEVARPGVKDGAAAPAVGGSEAAPGPTLMALPKHIDTILILIILATQNRIHKKLQNEPNRAPRAIK